MIKKLLVAMSVSCISTMSVLAEVRVHSVERSDQAYRAELVYSKLRCEALRQLGRMTEAERERCNLASQEVKFDVIDWMSVNQQKAIRLHEKVFYEFF